MHTLNFPLIDPHIHQWDPYSTPHAAAFAVKLLGQRPFLLDKMVRLVKPKDLIETVGLTEHITRPYLPQDYKNDLQHYAVEQVVHIEASWAKHKGKGVVGETEFIESLPFNEDTVKLGGIVATADPCDSNFKKILKLHQKASKRLRGIRRMAAFHEDKGVHNWTDTPHLYTQKKFLKGFEQLAQHNLSFDAWVYSQQIADVIELAKIFPETSIVLDHLGTPAGLFGKVGQNTGLSKTARENIFYQWQEDIAELSTLPNVYTKMSGLFMPVLGHQFYKNKQLASKQQIIDLVAPLILHALESFGTYRVMFASNFPMDRVNTSLVNIIDAFSDIVMQYDESALEKVFHHNAKQFYRL
ncbi:amidohydrolase family protein [Acinetobacter bereziniae]|jgi:predicted TIM-barrel fold metal-dependent hydrolase|uniref:amidohydrolase family protein n=1 Tax=Acinetobacter TaxID=469 RepID=UPI00073F9A3D|nr:MULTISPECIES: amidohydrolase family protein [Acinetobacter]ATZ63102.1 amidohydrolase [Acinetobacter bereziniae]MBO3653623.1 amidohydrolase family protein [Acinetobacter bereziniae]MCM8513387.1 amidohydrolase family protein [Acinetobacter bereziniae]MCU4417736.1 amidohydrolase family protein [Acinetobacter bereziniae]MDG3556061.1 amidohydrolase family protein [Acinetobacter bereziniae]